jgi:hypothetical protein
LPLLETSVTVTVTAQDGSIRNYTIKIKRGGDANADLSALVLSTGALDIDFSPGVVTYTQAVPNEVDAAAVKATVSSAVSSLVINGKAVESGSSFIAPLIAGNNPILIEVTSQSGVKKSYTSRSRARSMGMPPFPPSPFPPSPLLPWALRLLSSIQRPLPTPPRWPVSWPPSPCCPRPP